MTSYPRGYRPVWIATDARRTWLAPLAIALVVVFVLLGEVWQSSRVAQLALRLDQSRADFQNARSRLDYLRAEQEKRATRTQLEPIARQLKLKPARPQQVVLLPREYLAHEESPPRHDAPVLVALSARVARVLVPDARAYARETR